MITSTIKPKKNKEYEEAEFEKHSSKKKIMYIFRVMLVIPVLIFTDQCLSQSHKNRH